MSGHQKLHYRQFVSSDLESYKKTYKLCFGFDISEEYIQWKYNNNPAGKMVGFVALDGSTVAAFYGIIPEIYLVKGKPVRIYQSMDTMTHPDYQRRGLFSLLAQMTYDYIEKTEGELKIVGIPGSSSYPGFVNKLNWATVHQFSYTFCQKYIFKIRAIGKKKTPLEFTRIDKMTNSLAAFLDQRIYTQESIQPLISSTFFNWRVFQNMLKKFIVVEISQNNETIGVCVYTLSQEKRCFIYFLSFLNEKLLGENLTSTIQFLFKSTDSNYIYTWSPLNKSFLFKLRTNGFFINPFRKGLFSYRVPFIVKANPTFVDGLDWLNNKNYAVQPLMQD
jgi:hypothetical protein